MKKVIGVILALVCLFSLVACNDPTRNYIENDIVNRGDVEIMDIYYFEGQIDEIYEDSIKVIVLENNGSVVSSDLAIVSTKDVVIDFTMQVGDTVGITFEGGVAESYPVQIRGTMGIDLIRSYASMFEYIEEDGRIKYNGAWYNKDKLSEQTLTWLNLGPTDKMLSSYYPFEFVEGANLGLELSVENVSNKGLIIVCKHSTDKELTDVYDLQTGSFYSLEVLENDEYVAVEHSVENLAWTSEAWVISKDDETKWSLDWEWLYGRLPEGKYRIGKEIMNFKETGVFDTIMVYGYFEIK